MPKPKHKPQVPTETGCYVDSHWGHYTYNRIVGLAIEWGYEDNVLTSDGLHKLTQAYEDDAGIIFLPNEVKEPDTYRADKWQVEQQDVIDWLVETVDDIESWLNGEVPTRDDDLTYYWGSFEDAGGWGLMLIDDEGEWVDA